MDMDMRVATFMHKLNLLSQETGVYLDLSDQHEPEFMVDLVTENGNVYCGILLNDEEMEYYLDDEV